MDSNNCVCSRNNSCSRSSSGGGSRSSSTVGGDDGFRLRNSSSSSASSSSILGGDDGGLRRFRFMIVKVRCELCKEAASLYCAADEARLCWDCDALIHSANFLVARHSRTLLCPCCGALLSGDPSHPTRQHHRVCQSCTDQATASYNERPKSDEESKVERSRDQCCAYDDDESPSCLLQLISPPLGQARKRPPHACWIEGVGDSEEVNYCHRLSSSSASRFKRRKTKRSLPQPYTL